MIKNFGSGNGGPPLNQACSACKHQRRKCTRDCKLAPFFPADRSKCFQAVHKVFGVCNTLKLLSTLETDEEKHRAVDSLIWEATCRDRNPVDGSLGFFNQQMEDFQKERQELLKERDGLQKELVSAKNKIQCYEIMCQNVQHQPLMQSSHQLLQNNPPAYVPQDAYLYPMSSSMSQAPPFYYHDHGIQGGATNSSVGGLSRVHNIGGAQRAKVMVPQDQLYNVIDTLPLTIMVDEEHKPQVPQGI